MFEVSAFGCNTGADMFTPLVMA